MLNVDTGMETLGPRACPHCRGVMDPREFHEVTLELCSHCEGIWFDGDDLVELLRKDPQILRELCNQFDHDAPSGSVEIDLLCPDCEARLEKQRYLYNSPVMLETCPRCEGFWVRCDRFAEMQRWLNEGHEHSPLVPAGFRPVSD